MEFFYIDSIADFISIIGGLIGTILGTLGYIKSIKTEKRTVSEPYFKNIWPEISGKIKVSLETSKYLNQNIDSFIKNISRFNKIDPLPLIEVKMYDMSYSKKIETLCEKRNALVLNINNLLKEYYADWYYAYEFSNSVVFHGMYNVISEATNEEKESNRNEFLRGRAEFERRVQIYCEKPFESWYDLKNCQKYLSMLLDKKTELKKLLHELNSNKSMESTKQFYDTYFNAK